MTEVVEWGEFKERMGRYLDTSGKCNHWKDDISLGFSEAVWELEKEEGRPVYFGEVLYDLHKKIGAVGTLGQDVRHELKLAEKKAKKARLVAAISARDVEDAAKTQLSKEQLISDIHAGIKEKIKAMEKWDKRARISLLFQHNEPFLYCRSDEASKKTAFEKMDGGKTENNVARQFARWLLQKNRPRKSYLEL